MPVSDPRLRIGGKVTAKACHVVHLSKCAQRYGVNKHSKRLVGTVLDVTTTPVSVSTGHTSTLITTVYDFGESLFKEKTLNIRSVKAFVLPEDEGMSLIEEIAAEAAEADMEALNLMEESVEALVAEIVETPADIEPNTLVDTEPNSTVAEIVETPVDNTLADTESENLVATVHQTEWYVNEKKTRLDVNGHVYIRHFYIRTSVGDLIGQDSDNEPENFFGSLESSYSPQSLSSVAGPNYGPQLHPPNKEGDEEDEHLPHGIGKSAGQEEKQKDFYSALAEELVDNQYNSVGSRKVGRDELDKDSPTISRPGEPQCGFSAHLTPTKRKRKNKDGTIKNQRQQGRCLVCSKKTTHVCSVCKDVETIESKEPWICYTTGGQLCFAQHLTALHGS
ncbi:predicted protein [Phaeodactylum tricornutum CCAP 1055/1]|uniref:Uncharacterized protein n=3 Tax=Phaeodactylum tricornutum TaxID=2850 RepID=B7G5Y5_PHATC|nr:predicted protein [Phaeodactylum tricornutum CCAP 1055/1]EEC45770.1 predicted protein [Phaeodactylum tricornutum CCAP 1055/1]|eukprot:XP_002182483.1 predicted protein [Phaeodactylum tricornutum CCAP 1055/1]